MQMQFPQISLMIAELYFGLRLSSSNEIRIA